MSNDLNEVFPNTGYLKPHHIQESGEQVREIMHAETQEVEFKGTPGTRVIVEFAPEQGWPTQLSCTAAGARSIAQAIGSSKFDQWVGQRVELFVTDVFGYGKNHTVIRARAVEEGAV